MLLCDIAAGRHKYISTNTRGTRYKYTPINITPLRDVWKSEPFQWQWHAVPSLLGFWFLYSLVISFTPRYIPISCLERTTLQQFSTEVLLYE
jgi:hypothetical protein